MIPLARSLRPHPERDYLDAEQRALSAPEARPCPLALVRESLDQAAILKGVDPARKVAREWLRENRTSNGVRAASRATAEAAFDGLANSSVTADSRTERGDQ